MKTVSIVGARPQFIKCAPVSRELRKRATEVLVHTGQHYDDNMSDVFFRELEIPEPEYRLGVGSGRHGVQTGKMLVAIEEVLMVEQPSWVLVYGDTNSTLAGALAAAKLHIPVAHVEAGLRSFNRKMPEEINRVLTDHMADVLFCPTRAALENLEKEGIVEGVHLVGDVMYESLMHNLTLAEQKSRVLEHLGLRKGHYFVATVHRAENTDEGERIGAIVGALQELGGTAQVVWPMHPRTREVVERRGVVSGGGLRIISPVPYLDMLQLVKNASCVLTDSGGVQKEAWWLEVPCVTLREETEWVETVESGWNVLAGADPKRIVAAGLRGQKGRRQQWAGKREAAAIISRVLTGAGPRVKAGTSNRGTR